MLTRIHMVEAWGRGMSLILENEPGVQFEEFAGIFIAIFARPSFTEGYGRGNSENSGKDYAFFSGYTGKRTGEKAGENTGENLPFDPEAGRYNYLRNCRIAGVESQDCGKAPRCAAKNWADSPHRCG